MAPLRRRTPRDKKPPETRQVAAIVEKHPNWRGPPDFGLCNLAEISPPSSSANAADQRSWRLERSFRLGEIRWGDPTEARRRPTLPALHLTFTPATPAGEITHIDPQRALSPALFTLGSPTPAEGSGSRPILVLSPALTSLEAPAPSPSLPGVARDAHGPA